MAIPVEMYPGETLDTAVELLARVRALGLLTDGAEESSDIAGDVESFLEGFPHEATVPRCSVCAHVLEIESWDTPVEYCRNDCDEPEPPAPEPQPCGRCSRPFSEHDYGTFCP